jgi:outer membrane scaffolding protein for murein synthesis (MipA/OmpV family)
MKIKLFRCLLLSAAALFLSQSLIADEFSVGKGKRPLTLGLGYLYKDKPYKNYSSSERSQAVPIVLYEGEHFFARGASLGWDFLDSDVLELAVIGQFLGDGYDESDSKASAAVVWQSDDYNDYYYGVRSRARHADRYTADSDVNYRLGVVAVYQQPHSHWMFMGGLRYEFFGDEITDSTIVSEDEQLSALIGVAYTFK